MVIWSYYLFKGAFQICLCKETSVQARQLSKFAHLSGCPNRYIHHLPPKLQMTRKFIWKKWSYLTVAQGQCSTVTENISNAFSPSPFLKLSDGEIHKDRKIQALMQSVVKDLSFQHNQGFMSDRQATWPLSPSQTPLQCFAIAWERRCGIACFQLQQSSSWEVT